MLRYKTVQLLQDNKKHISFLQMPAVQAIPSYEVGRDSMPLDKYTLKAASLKMEMLRQAAYFLQKEKPSFQYKAKSFHNIKEKDSAGNKQANHLLKIVKY